LLGDFGVDAYSLAYVVRKAGLRKSQLVGEGSEEFRSMSSVSLASGEEETCSKSFLIGPLASDRTSYGRLSSTSHAVQPKDARIIGIIGPVHNVLKEADSGMF
jgi:hypothetical protein